MRRMGDEERRAFLLAAPARTAKLATVRADGRPHVVPIWFDLDGEELVFTTGDSSVKARAMARDPRVAVCVDDERMPFAYVAIEGRAAVLEDAPDLPAWAERIARRYVGDELAGAYGARNAVPGELLVRVTPVRIAAYAGVAD